MVFMSAADLAAAGRSPALPCRVNLPSNNDAVERELLVQQWLRVLPGKRYVARASLDDRQVLAKLFLGKRAAGKAEALLDVLGHRGVAVSESERARVMGTRDESVIQRWLGRALAASSVAELFGGEEGMAAD